MEYMEIHLRDCFPNQLRQAAAVMELINQNHRRF